jgi:uncharacterized ion transporter superfamily protein YfcC
MILLAHLATLVIPPGAFEMNGKYVVAGTYKQIEDRPAPSMAAPFLLIFSGFKEAGEIIAFVFIVGGIIAVIRATGAIDAVLLKLTELLKNSPGLLVAIMTTVFAVGASTVGMAEEYMPLVPLLVATCIAMRMDSVVALAMVYVGAGVGYGCAALNPFTVAIAKDIAGVPLESGAYHRWVLLFVILFVSVIYILLYARKIRRDPSKSLVADINYKDSYPQMMDVALTPERVVIMLSLAAMIGIFAYGVAEYEWYFAELCALFIGVGLLAAILGRLSPNKTAETFCIGASEMTTTALLIGFARTIEVVLTEAQVRDTIVHGIAQSLEGLSAGTAAVAMLGVQSVINFFIPSGSGQAYVTMPLMAPLADLTKVGRETAVFAYQFGDGFTNMIVPTNALLMGMLGLARIPYVRWLRFIMPLMGLIYIVAVIFLYLSAGDAWY